MNTFSDKQKFERLYYHQQTCPQRNVKRSISGRINMLQVRKSDLHEERKCVREVINQGKMKFFFSFLKKTVESNTNYNILGYYSALIN